MRVIPRHIILRNAYTTGDFAVANGVVSLALTALSFLWSKLKGYKKVVYTAGSHARLAIDLDSITTNNNGPHRLTLVNGNISAVQRELAMVVYGDATATASEIATEFAAKVQAQSGPNSVFSFISFNSGTNVLTVDLVDSSYPEIGYNTDIVGVTATNTPPVKPVGASDAALLAGYNPSAQYDKFVFHVEGTFREGNNDVPVIYEDIVYVDDALTVFDTEHAAVMGRAGVNSIAGLKAYSEAQVLP